MPQALAHLIENVLRQSGRLVSASEVWTQLEENGVALVPQYVDERSHPTAAIQAELEELASMPDRRVEKLRSGRRSKFQWIFE